MCKLFLVLFMFISISVFAQNRECEYFMNKIITDNDMTFFSSSESDTTYSVTATLPSYYDFELFQMKFNNLVREYSDISFYLPWTYDRETNMTISILYVTKKHYRFVTAYSKSAIFFIIPK